MMKIEFVPYFLCLLFAYVSCAEFSCPTISEGYPPFCICRYGPAYDNTTNTCPSPECPTASIAQPSYPNCTCTEKNSGYSAYINDCFQACPENSMGYWPTCDCDDKSATFDKTSFKCLRCPEDSDHGIYPDCSCAKVGVYNRYQNVCTKCQGNSTGVYPNCECSDENAVYNNLRNKCEFCVEGSSGSTPNCVCDNGAEYNVFGNYCEQCPFGTDGVYPKCECTDGGSFNGYFCLRCPWNSKGPYGNCTCEENLVYDREKNACYDCPSHSTGTYPSCTCNESYQYDAENNLCRRCPEDSTGIYPNCECSSGLFGIRYGECVKCPSNSTGIYPDCECELENYIFSAYINQCYIECGSDSVGLHPHCSCNQPGTFYEPEEFACKSNVGRECPKGVSIGTGPDCLCVQKNYVFNRFFWSCFYGNATFAYPSSASCPGGQTWPQCPVEIDRNTLLSLVG